MEKKRIFLIGPLLRNLTNFREELIHELVRTGYEVVLVAAITKREDWLEKLGVKLVDVQIDRRGTSIIHDIKLTAQYLKILKAWKPDLVLTYTTKCSVYGGIACTIKNIPYIVNNSGLYNKEDFSKRMWTILKILYKTGYNHAQCMMYQNTYERDVLNKLLHNKVAYRDIPGSGVNLTKYPYTGYPSEEAGVIFNYVARIVKIKGINEYLACAKVIKNKYPNTHFRIFGSFDDEAYRLMIEKAVQEGYIEDVGPQPIMLPFIQSCHAVIHPSYYEGMTNVVLEHSSVGRVCIASDIPGCREGIEDGVTGFLFEKKNPSSLIDAVERFLVLSQEERAEMGRRARVKMEKEFNRQIVIDAYMKEIERICQNKK